MSVVEGDREREREREREIWMREKKEERQQSLTNLIHLLFYFEKIFESEPDSLDNRQRGTERERQREKKRDRERGRETEKVRVRGTNRKGSIIKEFGLQNFDIRVWLIYIYFIVRK